jgi:hypothetical protein
MGMNLWAINPPSYVGRNIHEVLQELDGTKVRYNLAGNRIGYYVFIDDAKCLRLFTNTDTDIIDNVEYSRIYYSSSTLGDTVNYLVQKRIFEHLVEFHEGELGTLDTRRTDRVSWNGSSVGQAFMNPKITSYMISISELTGGGVFEGWSSN